MSIQPTASNRHPGPDGLPAYDDRWVIDAQVQFDAKLLQQNNGAGPKPPSGTDEALQNLDTFTGVTTDSVDPTTGETQQQMLSELSANWDKWGMHTMTQWIGTDASGRAVITFAPPADLPQHAKDVLNYLNNHPTLLNGIVQDHSGGKAGDPVTHAALDDFIKETRNDALNADVSLQFKGLKGADSARVNLLNPTLGYAAELTANWHAWGLHQGIDFAHPPADLPPEAKKVLGYFADNPALLDAIVVNAGGKPGDAVTQAAVNAYLGKGVEETAAAIKAAGTATPDEGMLQTERLAANWDTWGLHQGVDFNNPPAGLPQQAKDTLAYFAQHPTLFNAIVQGAGGKAGDRITLAAVQSFIGKMADEAKDPAAVATKASDWNSLAPNAADQQALNTPLTAAADLAAHWDEWGMHQGVNFANPPADLPQAAKDDLKILTSNPALMKALDAGGGDGAADGTITLNDVKGFISHAKADLSAATKGYSEWLSKHPNASAESKELARQESLLTANATLISGAADKSKGNGNISIEDLQVVAANPAIYGAELSQAARLFSKPGMFQLLDVAGDDSATAKPDNIVVRSNLEAWLKDAAPVSDADFASVMQHASLVSAVAGTDTSSLTADVFAHPGNYTGAQKAAVLAQLEQTYAKLLAGQKAGLWPDAGTSQYPNLNPNINKVANDLLTHISQLSGDADVQKFLSTTVTSNLQSMLADDPSLLASVKSSYQAFQNGQTLDAAIAAKGTDGKPVSLPSALASFVQAGNFFAQALGSGGKTIDVNIAGIVQKSSHYQEILAYYQNNVVTGKDLRDALSSGTDQGTALANFASEVASFGAVLPASVVQQNNATLAKNYGDIVAEAVLGGAGADQLTKIFASSNGQLDETQLNAIIAQVEAQDPTLFTDENGKPVSKDKIVNAFRQVFDAVRSGAKVSDALDKLKFPNLGNQTIQGAYGTGVLHAVSSLIAGGVLAAKATTGDTSPAQIASLVSSGCIVMGTALEAGGKYAAKNPDFNLAKMTSADLKILENAGKLIGGLGSTIGGVLGIISGVGQLADGDKANGALSIASGTAGVIAGVFALGDAAAGIAVAAGVTSFVGVDLAALGASLAALGGAFAIGAGVLGLIGLFVYLGIEGAKQQRRSSEFQGEVLPVLNQYGITGGPVESGDLPEPPSVGVGS
ncbi:type III effector HrpK domain-containing protein [Bradyrhizobium sp. USDA 4353]